MRILFLTSRLPYPPNRGDRLRAYYFIRSLARDHEISLISFIATPAERAATEELLPYCRQVTTLLLPPWQSAARVAGNIWRPEPLQALYYRHPAMQRLIDYALRNGGFEAVYIHLFRMAPYVPSHYGVYRVVDLTDVISSEVQRSLPYRRALSRLLYRFERPRIARYERRLARTFEELWLISPADRQTLQADCPQANIQVVRNGVDSLRFHPTGEPPTPNSLIFVGHLGVFHNVDAAEFLVREILPRVRQRIPDSRLRLIGAEPGPRVRALAPHPGVELLGYIPDLNAALNQSAVFVAPLRFAAGVQNKVLEAMAAGRPVVTTHLVNQGLGARPDVELLLADEPQTLAEAICNLLLDPQRARALGEAGRQFVRREFTWDLVRQRMQVIEGLVSARRRVV